MPASKVSSVPLGTAATLACIASPWRAPPRLRSRTQSPGRTFVAPNRKGVPSGPARVATCVADPVVPDIPKVTSSITVATKVPRRSTAACEMPSWSMASRMVSFRPLTSGWDARNTRGSKPAGVAGMAVATGTGEGAAALAASQAATSESVRTLP